MQSSIPAYLTAVIAFLVLVVSYRQWKVARDKFRLDLYNRRFGVLEKAERYYRFCMRDDFTFTEVSEMSADFAVAVSESIFLFDKKGGVSDAMRSIANAASNMTYETLHRLDETDNDDQPKTFHERLLTFHEFNMDSSAVLLSHMRELERCLYPYLYFGAERGSWEQWLHVFDDTF